MGAKRIAFDHEARDAVRRGVQKLARAVMVTLGPRGRNVILEKSFGAPTVTKDGVTVAREIELEDSFENMGAQMVKEVSLRTSDDAGDGTTTAAVLASAIFYEGLRNVTAGANPVCLQRGIQKAVDKITEELSNMSTEVKDKTEIAQVGSIAANNDPAIGAIIADAMEKVGKDGVITVEEGKTLDTTVDWVEGMQVDKGYLSPHFVTNTEEMSCVLEDPYILIHEKKIGSIKDLVPLLEKRLHASDLTDWKGQIRLQHELDAQTLNISGGKITVDAETDAPTIDLKLSQLQVLQLIFGELDASSVLIKYPILSILFPPDQLLYWPTDNF